MTKELTTTENDLSTLLARANELLNNPEEEYNVREFVKHSRLFTIHDYKEMGERPVSTYDCGSARLKDTPKVLYRALFLFAPEHVSFKKMYKEDPMTCVAVAPDLATEGAYCVCCGKPERVPDAEWLRLAAYESRHSNPPLAQRSAKHDGGTGGASGSATAHLARFHHDVANATASAGSGPLQ